MKIGIVTFHRAINIGAALQASAIVKYLNSIGNDAELIDLYPNNDIPRKSFIYSVLRKVKHILFYFKNKEEYIKNSKFNAFYAQYFCLSENRYFGDHDLKNIQCDYDVVVSGSDQVLNTTLTGTTTGYYLDFTESNKISYASSFGRENVSEKECELIKSELPKFSALSFREKTGRELVENLTGITGTDVLDPVFLLDKHYWTSICSENLKVPEKFIFVYVMEMTDGIKNAVITAQKELGLPVVVVNGSGAKNLIPGREDRCCGPTEFLRYLRDADLIITNSFHGMAFSIIFEKKTICVAHSKRNTRLESLLSYISATDKQIQSNVSDIDINDYLIIPDYQKMISMITKSQDYLRSAVDKCTED